ncbi:hypothetical protein [Octadecabacter antarcticus]|uniref:hypothetical protein n=1 Tax=Octadecabacter antarcticus TaxID=1217908 RepID=UPI0002F40D34|nr:hypothetical protein [Octadecabacter antarcticus]
MNEIMIESRCATGLIVANLIAKLAESGFHVEPCQIEQAITIQETLTVEELADVIVVDVHDIPTDYDRPWQYQSQRRGTNRTHPSAWRK